MFRVVRNEFILPPPLISPNFSHIKPQVASTLYTANNLQTQTITTTTISWTLLKAVYKNNIQRYHTICILTLPTLICCINVVTMPAIGGSHGSTSTPLLLQKAVCKQRQHPLHHPAQVITGLQGNIPNPTPVEAFYEESSTTTCYKRLSNELAMYT